MMDSTESERMSMLLSTYLDRTYTGTQQEVDIKRRVCILNEYVDRFHYGPGSILFNGGSVGEGFRLTGSDSDKMLTDDTVTVTYHDKCVPPNMACNTILYIRQADCRPGYVNLQLGLIGTECDRLLHDSLVKIEDSVFVSSDIYREQCISSMCKETGLNYESNGPSITIKTVLRDTDMVKCFRCNCWPKEAIEWITRTRLYGWPHQTLIDKIVHSGCHLVPVGDKCSEDTFLQWRISFATAEKSLVHSFSHIQFKVYCLLKYFLRQIKDTLKETIGDDDILCSYFLKTILFHAIENVSQLFWQDKNLFYCFWFCFNILLTWVRAGFCPNYFIPTNNMFQRKIHGQHQKLLLDILNNYCQMKWMCLSVGNFFKPSIWEHLCNTSMQADLACPVTVQKSSLRQDTITALVVREIVIPYGATTLRTIRMALNLLSKTQSEFDEVYTYHLAMKCLYGVATEQVYPEHMVATDNKTRYKSLRKCKRWMTPRALMGTELLYLATFHFLTGNFSKTLELSKQVIQLASYYSHNRLHAEVEVMHRHQYRQHGHTSERLRKRYHDVICFYDEDLYLPHFCLEMVKDSSVLVVPPLPYVVFLSFLCCHELADTRERDVALRHMIDVKCHDEQGGHKYWIVHTLLGICYEILGDTHRAIRAYWDSAQSKTNLHQKNPAIERIAVVLLCMYASQI